MIAWGPWRGGECRSCVWGLVVACNQWMDRIKTRMALPFFDSGARKKRDQMLAIDLGSRTTKAVQVQRRGNDFTLSRYVLLDAPVYDKTLSVELLTEHLKSVAQA